MTIKKKTHTHIQINDEQQVSYDFTDFCWSIPGNVFIWVHSPSLKILHFFSIFQIIRWAFPKEETRKIRSRLYQ